MWNVSTGEDANSEDLYQHSLPSDRPMVTASMLRRVRNLNIAALVVQACSGAAIIALTDPDLKYEWFTTFPSLEPPGTNGNPFIEPTSEKIFAFSTGYLSGAFLLLSALDHFIVCTFGKSAYNNGLKSNYNVFRWAEYSISASLMRIIIALLSGIGDITMLFLIFGLTSCTMLFGLVFELENSGSGRLLSEVRWYSFWIGFIPHFFAWGVIFLYFFETVSRGDPPDFVWSIIFIIFFLDATFAIVLGLQWLGKGIFRNYINGEIAFIILSFTSKNLLAWINFQGGNR